MRWLPNWLAYAGYRCPRPGPTPSATNWSGRNGIGQKLDLATNCSRSAGAVPPTCAIPYPRTITRKCCTTIKGFRADGHAMVIDASAVIAILLAEDDAERYTRAIEAAARPRMSAASYLEAAVVIDNRGNVLARREFDRFIRRAGIEVGAGGDSGAGVPGLREGTAPGGAEFRRLLLLRSGEAYRRAAAVQRRRFLSDRRQDRTPVML